jgi:hypothetical protein
MSRESYMAADQKQIDKQSEINWVLSYYITKSKYY